MTPSYSGRGVTSTRTTRSNRWGADGRRRAPRPFFIPFEACRRWGAPAARAGGATGVGFRTPDKTDTTHVKPAPGITDPTRMEERTHILERAAGVELPADYKKFLAAYEGGAPLADERMRYSLATAEVLAAPFPFDQP